MVGSHPGELIGRQDASFGLFFTRGEPRIPMSRLHKHSSLPISEQPVRKEMNEVLS